MSLNSKRIIAAAAAVLGVVVFGVTLTHAAFFSTADTDTGSGPPVAAPAGAPTAGDLPVRLQIPRLAIDANVQHVGVAKSGHMAVPGNYTDVAWYRYGAAPGSLGDAVMDGHVDNGLSLPGVFKHLNEIKVGDEIDVVGASGKRYIFAVSDIGVYPYRDVPVEKIFNQSDQPRLNLITCDGAWVQGEKTYDERLVVYATLAK